MFLKNFSLFDDIFAHTNGFAAILLHISRTNTFFDLLRRAGTKNKFSLFDLLRRAGTKLYITKKEGQREPPLLNNM